MFTNQHLEPIFSTPLFSSYLSEEDTTALHSIILDAREKGFGEERKFAWKSDDDLYLRPKMAPFTEAIVAEVQKALSVYDVIYNDIYINNMWAQISTHEHYHTSHIHPNSYFSGIIYLTEPEHAGETKFHNTVTDSVLIRLPFREYNSYNAHQWWIKPEKGLMLLFPSWIPHSVEQPKENVTYDDRCTLSFTVMLGAENLGHTVKWRYV